MHFRISVKLDNDCIFIYNTKDKIIYIDDKIKQLLSSCNESAFFGYIRIEKIDEV